MGREWLVRKDMILAIVQTSLGNTELSLRIINSLEKKHGDMLKTEQYRMVEPFIRLFKNYIKNPQVVNQEDLSNFEEKIKLKKDRSTTSLLKKDLMLSATKKAINILTGELYVFSS